MATEKTKNTWELEIDDLKKRNRELYEQQHKLEEELRPHRDREYKEKQRAENEKRTVERDQRLIETLTRMETLITTHVKDPALRETAFQYVLYANGPMMGWR